MLPNLLLVGAAKSGTTSVANFLSKNEQIFVPNIKECRYFSQLGSDYIGLGAEAFVNSGVTNYEEYIDLFESRSERILADCSNDYLYYHERAIPKITNLLGQDVKILIVLRNPIDRAFSNYLHSIREGWEDLTFMQALEAENERISKHWAWSYHYANAGFYFEAVKAYLDNFNNVKIILFEELEAFVHDDSFYNFLGIKNNATKIKFGKDNISGNIRSKFLWKILHRNSFLKVFLKRLFKVLGYEGKALRFVNWIKMKNLGPAKMNTMERNYLRKVYKYDILKLSKLIDRDLDHWINNN